MIIWADYVSQGHDDEMDTLILQFRHLPVIADDHGRHWFFNIQLEPSLFLFLIIKIFLHNVSYNPESLSHRHYFVPYTNLVLSEKSFSVLHKLPFEQHVAGDEYGPKYSARIH